MTDWRLMAERVLGVAVAEPVIGASLAPALKLTLVEIGSADSALIAHVPEPVEPSVPVHPPSHKRPIVPVPVARRKGPRCPSGMPIEEHFNLLGGHAGILEVYGDLDLAHRLWDSHRLWLRDAGTTCAERWDHQYRATWHRFHAHPPQRRKAITPWTVSAQSNSSSTTNREGPGSR